MPDNNKDRSQRCRAIIKLWVYCRGIDWIYNVCQFELLPPSSHLRSCLSVSAWIEKWDADMWEIERITALWWGKGRPLIPIETKLIEGNRVPIDFAMETKERFAKTTRSNTLILKSQKIHLHLLSRIWSVFQTRILLKSEQASRDWLSKTDSIRNNRSDLQTLETTHFIIPILKFMDDLLFNGNCHIRWI